MSKPHPESKESIQLIPTSLTAVYSPITANGRSNMVYLLKIEIGCSPYLLLTVDDEGDAGWTLPFRGLRALFAF